MPVFFEIPDGQVADFVGEMLRLGVDRQSFRWLESGGSPVALLRVVGPPYFSLLRAIDRADRSVGPIAYVEQAPRVLVEFGHRHPFADRITPVSGRIVMMRAPRDWRFAEEGPFRDIYGSLNFSLPASPKALNSIELSRRYPVSMRLARGTATEAVELWVLRDRAEEQVESLVGSSDDHLISRLAFAVGESVGDRGPTVVIRVRPSKQPPPALILDGVGYRPYLRLPNLFLPTGTRLHPPLRRDAVARLLASDPERVHWLAPSDDGGFTPESLPDSAFRPLDQWVDYVLDREHRPLQAWVESTRFEFEPFECGEDPEGDSPRPERKRRRKKDSSNRITPGEIAPEMEATRPQPEVTPDFLGPPKKIEPDAAMLRLGELEVRYRKLDSPPEATDRREILVEMAGLNAILDRPADASACWSLAVWEVAEPPKELVTTWAESASKGLPASLLDARGFDRLLSLEQPTASDLRGLATTLMRLAFADCGRSGDQLVAGLDRIQPFLERHEGSLPARMAWLAWVSVYRLNRGDVLALARARDRLLERLHRGGLRPDLDLPGFLRFGVGVSAERIRLIHEHLLQFRESAATWVDRGNMVAPNTRVLADLIFAFGLARLGDRDLTTQCLRSAQKSTKNRDAVMMLLTRGFEHRISQVLEGKPVVGPLPSDLMARLDRMGKEGGEEDRKKEKEQRYKVDRLRKNSRILEPLERINPYRHWASTSAEGLSKELSEWADVSDRDELSRRVFRTLAAPLFVTDGAAIRAGIVKEALEVAFRLGEESAIKILGLVLLVGDATGDVARQAELLEKGLRVAAHFDRTADVRAFVGRFDVLLASGGSRTALTLEPLIGQCFRGLRKLGLHDEIERLLRRISEIVLKGHDFTKAGPRNGPQAIEWSRTLKLMLQVASVWFDFGEGERAGPVLDEVRSLLRQGELIPVEQTSLACSYIRSMALAPAEMALSRMEEVFDRLERVHDSFTTTSHYSLSRLDVVEAAVATLVSDDFALDRSSREQLEDDEFFVRRRIHRDVREALEAGH